MASTGVFNLARSVGPVSASTSSRSLSNVSNHGGCHALVQNNVSGTRMLADKYCKRSIRTFWTSSRICGRPKKSVAPIMTEGMYRYSDQLGRDK